MPNPIPIWVLSLGCPKNRVDTEKLIGSLGVSVKTCRQMGKSRIALINTCAFIEPATRESIRAVIDAVERLKKLKRKPLLVVAGCMVGRYGEAELAREFPEVDLWLPTDKMDQWPAMTCDALKLAPPMTSARLVSTGPAWAWLKISEGCQHQCAFCAIPSIRGPLRSEPLDNIINEAKNILAAGIREINLVAQDLTAWGSDFQNAETLSSLLRALAELPGLAWLRMLYLYPGAINRRLLREIRDIGAPLLPYLDIPLQHAEPEILAGMGRPFKVDPSRLIGEIREILPDAALRATMIVGYPGETEAQFARLLEFTRKARFHHLGVFTFQPEDGTRAASLPNQVPDAVKTQRRNELMGLQAQISSDILRQYVGSRMTVLVDEARHEEWPGLHGGRVWFQAPEVDGLTWVSGAGVAPGKMPECEIVESQTYDLVALA